MDIFWREKNSSSIKENLKQRKESKCDATSEIKKKRQLFFVLVIHQGKRIKWIVGKIKVLNKVTVSIGNYTPRNEVARGMMFLTRPSVSPVLVTASPL
jgi:hypothetical protein